MRNVALAVLLVSVVAASRPYRAATQAIRRSPPGQVDCTPYEPAGLVLTPERGDTWVLERSDGARFRLFANRADAEAGLAVFKQHTALCYIGRGNSFPEPYRKDYVMEFLKK